jgi:uncharacterized protein
VKVCLDANILFSAARPDSPLRAMVLSLIKQSACVTNSHAVTEAQRNIASKQPQHSLSGRELIDQVPLDNRYTDPSIGALPEKDRPILGGAIAAHCTHLLTGDRTHFGSLYGHRIKGVEIVSPRQLADQLIQLGWAEIGTTKRSP